MKIEVGSTWVNKNDLDNTVTVDTVGAFAVTGHSDKDSLYMANIDDFLHYFKPLTDTYCRSLRELSEQEFENIIDEAFEEGYAQAYSEIKKSEQNLNYRMGLEDGYESGYNDGWHDCEASFELGNEFTDSIQEQAYDEGYDQAIDDLIEAGVTGEDEEDYLDEEDSDEEYSEYEFGAVEDDEEDYCFSKELDKILNSEKAQYKVDPSVPSMGNRYDENGKLCGFFINTGNKKIGGITTNTKEDLVNNPSHYNSDPSGVKCIEITRHRNNNIGNVIKYVWRNGLKGGNSNIQDLEKAAWYLNDEIQRLKGIE